MEKAGERLVRSVTDEVAACLKPSLEREPSLRGEMSFDLDVGSKVIAKRSESGLGDLSAARCIEGALGKAQPPPGPSGKARYTLAFGGKYEAAALREGVEVFGDWIARDWNAPSGRVPDGVAKVQESLREPIRRCGFGAEPEMNEKLWLVLRVAKGGAVMLGPGGSGEASGCIRRVIGAAPFPDAGHDYALSVSLSPESAVLTPTADSETEQQEFGMIGLLGSGALEAIPAPGDSGAVNMWGEGIGEAFGAGGLGLGGLGTQGSGIGTIGTGQGFGSGKGRLGGKRTKPPSVRMGETAASSGLPPEVIKRIVRQNFGRFRLCYENALRNNPKLAGKVTVKFDIDRLGEVKNVSATTDMKDKSVSSCVTRAFYGLSFPQPEGGVVKVTYPIKFKPSDDAPDPVPTAQPELEPQQTIKGKPIAEVTIADVASRLVEKSFQVAEVPGFAKDQTPLLFIRDASGSEVFALTVGPVATEEASTCIVGKPEHMVRVYGDGCQRVMSPLLD